MGRVALGVASGLAALIGLAWLGLRIRPRPFASYERRSASVKERAALKNVPIPEGLPAPVERFFRGLYGDEVPLINTAVVTGRAIMRPFRAAMPARYRFIYEAGKGYRHYIETTFWGLPIMRVEERYLDGHGRLEIPIIGVAEGAKTDAAANQGLWAETALFPAVWITDPRVRWEPVDEHTARMIVPFGEEEQEFMAYFDPDSGRLQRMETMRFRDEAGNMILWQAITLPGKTIEAGGALLNATGEALWTDMEMPWATFTAEEVVYNVDVRDYIRARGP
jgi:hypothetical protein